jgi:hypothetical protein
MQEIGIINLLRRFRISFMRVVSHPATVIIKPCTASSVIGQYKIPVCGRVAGTLALVLSVVAAGGDVTLGGVVAAGGVVATGEDVAWGVGVSTGDAVAVGAAVGVGIGVGAGVGWGVPIGVDMTAGGTLL